MTIRANMFTPEVLLSAPRRSAGVPNANGTSVLYTTSTYSFSTHGKKTELRHLDIKSNESRLLTDKDGISEPVWLADEASHFVCLESGKNSSTNIVIGSASQEADWKDAYTAGNIEAPASSLKIAKLSEDSYAIVLAIQTYPDGSIFNPESAPQAHSTGKLYNSLFVRHWDEYITPERNALFYGVLKKGKDGQYKLSELVNALKGTGLESPVSPFGGTDSFDVSRSGIIFVSKDPKLNPALNVKCNVYYIPLSTFSESEAPKPVSYELPNFQGASTAPIFSPDAKSAAFLSMLKGGYESEKSQIFIIPNLEEKTTVRLLKGTTDEGSWDRSAQNVYFSNDGRTLYFSAEDEGYGCLFSVSADPKSDTLPQRITKTGTISDIQPLGHDLIFTSSSTLTDNSIYTILDPVKPAVVWTQSATKSGSSLGINAKQVSSIRVPASNPSVNPTTHAWVVKPSHFDSSKKYPLAVLIHGGPQGAWGDSWSTRWNPMIFAEAGYIAVAPNPTGSTGYGQDFTDAIRKDWGGAPYNDLVNVVDYITEKMPEVDMENAVALGASYGGYMINWMNGHDLGRRFKALVCHDGIFSFAGLLATEELYFPFYDLGGTPWFSLPKNGKEDASKAAVDAQQTFGKSSVDAWEKNDPSKFLDKWSTPQLVVHSSKDYRLCISEGLAAFNVLQARGIESQFLTFPDENHWVLKPENSLLWHKVVLNWINKHVGLPLLYAEDGQGMEFFGGERKAQQEVVNMIGMGRPET